MYANSKELVQRTLPNKVLKDRAYETALNPKYDGCQRDCKYDV